MWKTLRAIWTVKDIRASVLFIFGMLAIFRLAAHIPVPGVDAAALQQLFNSNQLLSLLNLFSGGGMKNFSIVMMGVAPYITSSIIFQLLAMIVPALEEMQKEETGRHKIAQWTRYATVPFAMLQSYGMIRILQSSQLGILGEVNTAQMAAIIVTVTAGSIFLMWIGELISEKNVGNGISILIFAGIIAGLPSSIQQFAATYDPTQLFAVLGFVVVALATIVGVVIITEGQRNIPVSHARAARGGSMYGGVNTHLPIRVNMAGVMPIIFAISVVLFPPMIAQFFVYANTAWIANLAQSTITLFQNQLFYAITYFVLVFGFTYFYTEVVFHPERMAENLQKQGAFVPGIRPGKQTEAYLSDVTYKVIFFGALFLAIIAIMPLVLQYLTGIRTLTIGGTSILIVVAVVIEIVKQLEAQLTMRQYETY